jgi:hypothetical protein
LTKAIHPKPRIIIAGVKPKRIRRTKAQMAEARLRAELESAALERLARCMRPQIAKGLQLVSKWLGKRPSRKIREAWLDLSQVA